MLDTDGMKILHMLIANHDPARCVDVFGDLMADYGKDAIVCESFLPRWGQKFELDSVYLIGALQGRFGKQLQMVAPATHMGLVPKAKLTDLMKAQGYKVGKGHSRMALSVALYYAAFKMRDLEALAFLEPKD